jgi:abequosyltransferase
MNSPALGVTPTLTIAIPTFQRAGYLQLLLERLSEEFALIEANRVEVLVSDNDSTDGTPDVVTSAQMKGLPVRYVRNTKNIGSDHNIAQCFNLARGRYVLIMGDDDLLVDGMLPALLIRLLDPELGAVLLRPYGYDEDYLFEAPRETASWRDFQFAECFLLRAGSLITLISSCIVNKRLLQGLDARQFCGSNLVQVHLVLRSAMAGRRCLSYEGYGVACKRNNSGGYAFFEVFVERLLGILDLYVERGLSTGFVQQFERRLLRGFYPYYVFRELVSKSNRLTDARRQLEARFIRHPWYRFGIKPMLILPRPLAIAWGAAVVAIGRAMSGDLNRGWRFVFTRTLRRLQSRRGA